MESIKSLFRRKQRVHSQPAKNESETLPDEGEKRCTKLNELEEVWFACDKDTSPRTTQMETLNLLKDIAINAEIPEEIRTFISMYIRFELPKHSQAGLTPSNCPRSHVTSTLLHEQQPSPPKDFPEWTDCVTSEVCSAKRVHMTNLSECEYISDHSLNYYQEFPSNNGSRSTVEATPRVKKAASYILTHPRSQAKINAWLKSNRISTLELCSQDSYADFFVTDDDRVQQGKIGVLDDESQEFTTLCNDNDSSVFKNSHLEPKFDRQRPNSNVSHRTIHWQKLVPSIVTSTDPSIVSSAAPSITTATSLSSMSSKQDMNLESSSHTVSPGSMIIESQPDLIPLARTLYQMRSSVCPDKDWAYTSYNDLNISEFPKQLPAGSGYSIPSIPRRMTTTSKKSLIYHRDSIMVPNLEIRNANRYSELKSMAGPYPVVPSIRHSTVSNDVS